MSKNISLRNRAMLLRSKGYTYSEIQDKLGVKIAKSKLSNWCKEILLPTWYKSKIAEINKKSLNKARVLAIGVNKKKRSNYLNLLKEKNMGLVNKLTIDQQKLLLSILYLGEGAKHNAKSTLTLGSSNPSIIKFYLKLLKNCFAVDGSKFRVRIQCRFDQNIKDIEKYWEKITKINKKQFYPTYIDQRTKGKVTLKKNYMGVCTIHYFSKEVQLELIFLADAIIDRVI